MVVVLVPIIVSAQMQPGQAPTLAVLDSSSESQMSVKTPPQSKVNSQNKNKKTLNASKSLDRTGSTASRKEEFARRESELLNAFDLAYDSANMEHMASILTELRLLYSANSLPYLRRYAVYLSLQKNYTQSLQVLYQILERLPADLESNLNAAMIEIYLNRAPQAISRLRRIQIMYPYNPMAMQLLNSAIFSD